MAKGLSLSTWLVASLLAAGGVAIAQETTPEEPVAALKQSLAENQARLRQYEWVETTAVSLKGEEGEVADPEALLLRRRR